MQNHLLNKTIVLKITVLLNHLLNNTIVLKITVLFIYVLNESGRTDKKHNIIYTNKNKIIGNTDHSFC